MPGSKVTRKGQITLLCLIIVAASFALRAYHLDRQSLWGDEAWSVFFAQQAWPQILGWLLSDNNPPLYYFLLKTWVPLAGTSEYALRFFSLFFSVAAVALLFPVGKRLLGPWAGLLASLLLAFSAFDLYLAQEARMYSLLAFLVLLSIYLLLKVLERNKRLLPLYALAAAASLYTHDFAILSLGAQALFMVFLGNRYAGFLTEGRGEAQVATSSSPHPPLPKGLLLSPLTALGFALVVYLPWALTFAASPSSQESLDFSRLHPAKIWAAVSATGGALAAGTTLEPAYSQWAALLLLPFLLLGAVWLARVRMEGILAGLSLAVPLVGIMASLVYIPYFFPRYLLFALWAYLLLLAAGLVALSRRHWALVLLPLLLFLGANTWSASNLYARPSYSKSGYQTMIAYLESHLSSGDAVVLNTHNQVPLFGYYASGLPYRVVQPAPGLDLEREMEEATRGRQGLWLVLFGNVAFYDRQREVEGWLARQAFYGAREGFGDVSLAYYALAPEDEGARQPLTAGYGGLVNLEEYRLDPAHLSAGDSLRISLVWRANATMDRDYTVFLHLLNSQRVQVAGVDSPPQTGLAPTRSWRPGQVIEDRYSLRLPPGLPAAPYHVEVGLYRSDGERLPLEDGRGTSILLGPVEVR